MSDMKDISDFDRFIASAEKELSQLDARRSALIEKIQNLQKEKELSRRISSEPRDNHKNAQVTNVSSESKKILLFSTLFKGREDVYPKRFESRSTGKSGYQPACRNEWLKGIL
jgi:hypothetical protein